jgi:hypothetical protein
MPPGPPRHRTQDAAIGPAAAMTASAAHPCTSRAEVLVVLREHFPALASEFKLSSLVPIAP